MVGDHMIGRVRPGGSEGAGRPPFSDERGLRTVAELISQSYVLNAAGWRDGTTHELSVWFLVEPCFRSLYLW